MTSAPSPQSLGPITEARFARAFAESATITAQAAAELLGVDVRTLKSMTEDLTIRAVRRGKLRSYTEADLRAYLTDAPDACRSTREKPRQAQRRGKVVPFSLLTSARHERL